MFGVISVLMNKKVLIKNDLADVLFRVHADLRELISVWIKLGNGLKYKTMMFKFNI